MSDYFHSLFVSLFACGVRNGASTYAFDYLFHISQQGSASRTTKCCTLIAIHLMYHPAASARSSLSPAPEDEIWPQQQAKMILSLRHHAFPPAVAPKKEVRLLEKKRHYHGLWEDPSLEQALVSGHVSCSRRLVFTGSSNRLTCRLSTATTFFSTLGGPLKTVLG